GGGAQNGRGTGYEGQFPNPTDGSGAIQPGSRVGLGQWRAVGDVLERLRDPQDRCEYGKGGRESDSQQGRSRPSRDVPARRAPVLLRRRLPRRQQCQQRSQLRLDLPNRFVAKRQCGAGLLNAGRRQTKIPTSKGPQSRAQGISSVARNKRDDYQGV